MAETGPPAPGGDDSAARVAVSDLADRRSPPIGVPCTSVRRFDPRAVRRVMFHVKICGITNPADAITAVAAGADAVGLNFVSGSPRYLDRDRGRAVAAAVPPGVLRVGVFAGAAPTDMLELASDLGLNAIQLHGCLFAAGAAGLPVDEPATCMALAGLPVIRAVRLEADGLAAARRWLDAAADVGRLPDLVLIDACPPRGATAGSLGGTGSRVDWDALVAAGPLRVPLALAGGLTAENVALAIGRTGVRAVDVASGVESTPGVKDPAKVQAFVAAARTALGAGRG